MNKASRSIVVALTFACLARTPAASQTADSIAVPAGSTIPVMLEKWVDARKNKVGDEISAKTTQSVKSGREIVIPRGSKIVGHVTEVKTKTNQEPESAVGIKFDRVVLKDGRQIPLALTIQAVAPAQQDTPIETAMAPGTAGGVTGAAPPLPGQGNASGPMADPNAGTPGRIASPNPLGSEGELSTSGALTPSCHGVLGIEGLTLEPEIANSKEGSVIASQRRNVRLDGRTQMMLRVTAP